MSGTEVFCKDCGRELSMEDSACPSCGGKGREYKVALQGKIETHVQTKGKARQGGTGKPFQEFKVGDDFHTKFGKWNYREMDINHRNDSYKEIIKDKTTGEIIYKCEEPLSKHTGHGSAKHKKKSC